MSIILINGREVVIPMTLGSVPAGRCPCCGFNYLFSGSNFAWCAYCAGFVKPRIYPGVVIDLELAISRVQLANALEGRK